MIKIGLGRKKESKNLDMKEDTSCGAHKTP